MKLDVLFWGLIAFSQYAVWNLNFEGWEHGWSMHNAFWARRLPAGVPAVALSYLGALALVVAVLQMTRRRLLVALGLVLGLPFVWWVLYHCWVPYLFDCCSLWHHGGNYRHFDMTTMAWKTNVDYPKPQAMLKAWAKEYKESIRVMPLLHGSPFFVDLGNILLTILVVLAYYYSLRAFVWPRDGVDEEEVVAVKPNSAARPNSAGASDQKMTTTISKKKKEEKDKENVTLAKEVAVDEKSAATATATAAAAATPKKKQETKVKKSVTPSKSKKNN